MRVRLIILLLFGLLFDRLVGGDRIISASVEIKASVINRSIASQSFPVLTGSYQEINYNIKITRPCAGKII